jgi:branched-subunit amino acid ABC-type transport system permease component
MGIRYSLYVIVVPLKMLGVSSNIAIGPVFEIGGGVITNLFLWAVPTTLVCVLALELMFVSTKTGKAMRAVAENVSLAAATGIDINRIRRITWIISGGLAGVAGLFWSMYTETVPELGWSVLLRGFAASTIGGLTSFSGTIVGGYIIGTAENLAMDMMNRYLGIDIVFKPAIMFIIMVVFLLFKPTGLVLEYGNVREYLRKAWEKVHFGR